MSKFVANLSLLVIQIAIGEERLKVNYGAETSLSAKQHGTYLHIQKRVIDELQSLKISIHLQWLRCTHKSCQVKNWRRSQDYVLNNLA